MSDTFLQVRLDPKMKAEAEQVFSSLGLSSSQAVKLFFRQVALRQAIPFSLTLTPPIAISPEEEEMLASSMREIQNGQGIEVDMSNQKQVNEFFDL